MSRIDELQATQHLALKLSRVLNQAYEALSEDEEKTDIDTYIIEPSGKRVSIQNVTSEGDVLWNMNRNTKAFNNNRAFEAREVNHLKWTREVLTKKEAMGYSKPEELVIVVRGSMPTAPPNLITQLKPTMSRFAGIYYVSVPNTDQESGYILALKPYRKTPDLF